MGHFSITQRVALEARNIIICKKHAEGATVAELSKEFKLSERHISVYIIGHNREPRYKRLSPLQKRLLIQMWEAGESLRSIANALSIHDSQVKRWRRRFGLPARPLGGQLGKRRPILQKGEFSAYTD